MQVNLSQMGHRGLLHHLEQLRCSRVPLGAVLRSAGSSDSFSSKFGEFFVYLLLEAALFATVF